MIPALFEVTPFARPLDNWTALILLTVGYLAAMVLLALMRPKVPLTLRWLSFVHNMALCAYSLYGFLGFASVLLHNWRTSALSASTLLLCDAQHSFWKGEGWRHGPGASLRKGADYWQYIFVLSKVYEWIDTAILILRGKEVMPPKSSQYALHLFHHTVALSIAWTSWHYPLGASWTGPLTNTLVHFFMVSALRFLHWCRLTALPRKYGYYAATEFGLPRRFGLFITPMQLVQFYFCLGFAAKDVVFALLYPGQCNCNLYTLVFVSACYVVFLVMFLGMYMEKKRAHQKSA